jgi:hypothetical protein
MKQLQVAKERQHAAERERQRERERAAAADRSEAGLIAALSVGTCGLAVAIVGAAVLLKKWQRSLHTTHWHDFAWQKSVGPPETHCSAHIGRDNKLSSPSNGIATTLVSRQPADANDLVVVARALADTL